MTSRDLGPREVGEIGKITMSLYVPYSDDRKAALIYWRDHELKVFAVDVLAGPQKKPTYAKTWYARARSQERAIACVQRDGGAFGIPARARYQARLAGPRELGCVPAKSSGTA